MRARARAREGKRAAGSSDSRRDEMADETARLLSARGLARTKLMSPSEDNERRANVRARAILHGESPFTITSRTSTERGAR